MCAHLKFNLMCAYGRLVSSSVGFEDFRGNFSHEHSPGRRTQENTEKNSRVGSYLNGLPFIWKGMLTHK